MQTKTLEDRMKEYENISRIYLTKKSPVIIRIDGRAFHTFTKGLKKPWDDIITECMLETTRTLCRSISGCKLGYYQSDEISLLLTDYETNETQPWFDNNLQKLVSVSASIATAAFNEAFCKKVSVMKIRADLLGLKEERDKKYFQTVVRKQFKAMFDARAFILPKEEVCNYFIWRQQDAIRNSVEALAQSLFPQKELQGLKREQLIQKMIDEKSFDWNTLPIAQQRGVCVTKADANLINSEGEEFVRTGWMVDNQIPLFVSSRNYIDELVFI